MKKQMKELNLVLEFARTMDGSRWRGLPVLFQGHQWEGGGRPLRMLTMEGTWRGQEAGNRSPGLTRCYWPSPRPHHTKAPFSLLQRTGAYFLGELNWRHLGLCGARGRRMQVETTDNTEEFSVHLKSNWENFPVSCHFAP